MKNLREDIETIKIMSYIREIDLYQHITPVSRE